jgi:hypothetical protein
MLNTENRKRLRREGEEARNESSKCIISATMISIARYKRGNIKYAHVEQNPESLRQSAFGIVASRRTESISTWSDDLPGENIPQNILKKAWAWASCAVNRC